MLSLLNPKLYILILHLELFVNLHISGIFWQEQNLEEAGFLKKMELIRRSGWVKVNVSFYE